MRIRRLEISLMIVLIALSARAVDGVAEISEACAVQTGCFNGDLPGYPVTIDGTAGGSYRLTSNLIVPDGSADGIAVSRSSITIGLNGFEIVRSGCEGATVDCSPGGGTGSGVEEIFAGTGSQVSGNAAYQNGGDGIFANSGSNVSNNSAANNEGNGFSVDSQSTASGNVARGNKGLGISAGLGPTISHNTASGNLVGAIINCP